MKPLLAIPSRVSSEKRATAARANGAKSRGPAIGKANSSRNSRRHGLRSRILFADPESPGQLNDLLASLERLLQPQSEIERTLIGTMALARWRQTRLWKLETSILNREISRLTPLMPNESSVTLIALAFRSLIDHGCSLQIINRLESRCKRQYDRAADRLNALRAHGIFKKTNIHERTQEVVENTAPHPALTHSATVSTAESQSVGNPNHKKITRERKYGTLDR
jgi:hypothetical protein